MERERNARSTEEGSVSQEAEEEMTALEERTDCKIWVESERLMLDMKPVVSFREE